MMNSIMRDVIKRGYRRTSASGPWLILLEKTELTMDQWTLGFFWFNDHTLATTTCLVDDSKKVRWDEWCISALPIWVDYMRVALEGVRGELFDPANGIVTGQCHPAAVRTIIWPQWHLRGILERNAPAELQDPKLSLLTTIRLPEFCFKWR
jgi:membrane carboxypeptidase/penicillin-binding protein